MNTSTLLAMVAGNLTNIVVSAVCIACLVLILRSNAIPPEAARIGAAGFACLLLEAALGIGAQIVVMTARDVFETYRHLGLAMAAAGLVRVALNIAGLVLIARAIFVGRVRAQPA